jgi:hypothetical protein
MKVTGWPNDWPGLDGAAAGTEQYPRAKHKPQLLHP